MSINWPTSVTQTLSSHMVETRMLIDQFYHGAQRGVEWTSYELYSTSLHFLKMRNGKGLTICPQAWVTRNYDIVPPPLANDNAGPAEDPGAPDGVDDAFAVLARVQTRNQTRNAAEAVAEAEGSADHASDDESEEDVGRVTRSMTNIAMQGAHVLVGEQQDDDDDDGEDEAPEEPSGYQSYRSGATTPAPDPEKQYRIPDFVDFFSPDFAADDVVRMVAHFWEMKSLEIDDLFVDPLSKDVCERSGTVIEDHLPQLAEQAQLILNHFPRQSIVGGFLVVGIWWRYFEFSRKLTPSLACLGDSRLRFTPPEVMKILHKKTKIYPLLSATGEDYHPQLKKYWTGCISRCVKEAS